MARIKRRIYIVDSKLQYKLVAVIVFYFLVILAVVAISLFLPLFQGLHDTNLDMTGKGLIAEKILFIHIRFWPAFIFISAILTLHSIVVFHRIVGPLYRFRMFYKTISAGDLSGEVKIRKNDYLHRDERLLNDMLAGLRARIDAIRKEHDLLHHDLQRLGSMDVSDANPGIFSRIDTALKRSDSLKKALQGFICNPEQRS